MGKSSHVLVVPFPAQGHINPILQFGKRLASNGQKVTMLTATTMLTESMQAQAQAQTGSINFHRIPDEFVDGVNVDTTSAYLDHLKKVFAKSLEELVAQHKLGAAPRVVVYDSIMPWVLDIAHAQGLYAAPFFTQICAVNCVYYHLQRGNLELPVGINGSLVSLPTLPLLRINDLPSFAADPTSYPCFYDLLLTQFSNFHKADWVFFNTFDELEPQTVKWMQSQWPIMTVGPSIPSIYLDRRVEDDSDYSLSFFKPNDDACIEWLNNKENGSVVYVAFGSLANLGEEQMKEMAWGLRNSGRNFLWVVRDTEEVKLPPNFCEDNEMGLVVSWCPQLQVLSHKAIGCFFTHCGWNSAMEAICLGVPMVAMPIWTDQTTNAKYIEDVWDVGIRVKPHNTGLVTREDIEARVNQVMERSELRVNAMRWKEVAKKAIEEGGSSYDNIQNFITKLVSNDC